MGTNVRSANQRLDHLLMTRKVVRNRDAAIRMILAGEVKVNGVIVDKPAKAVPFNAMVEAFQRSPSFVSRGGEKLAAALDACAINPEGMVCFDVGCSTGGFTDCLLQRGAAQVYAVDVGYGQFDWRLRQDPRIVLIERTNVRHMERSAILKPIGLAVVDVSFISLTKILPSVIRFLSPGAIVVALVKPQFEVGKGQVGRGGIVRDDTQRQKVLQGVVRFAEGVGLRIRKSLDSSIRGKKGNREIFAVFDFTAPSSGI